MLQESYRYLVDGILKVKIFNPVLSQFLMWSVPIRTYCHQNIDTGTDIAAGTSSTEAQLPTLEYHMVTTGYSYVTINKRI